MDVHYRSKHWQQMKDGINEITKDAITNLRQADELVEDIQERIQDLDSDRCIDFYHRKQEKKINTLLEDYTTLQNYCDKAGQIVYEHIDEPFYKKMDEFAQTMRDISIRDFQTKNRMGATTTTTLPSSHAYGVPQTITTKKEKITVDDIFKDSLAFDHVLRAQYKEVKKQNPDAKLNYKEYRQLVPSMRGFEYTSIEDEQKKLEAWRDVAISGALIVTTIFCPPLGIAASVVYGGLQVKSAIEGEDWGTHRKLSKEEQVEAGFFGALDLIPGLGSATKAFKGTLDLGSLAKLTKWKEGIADFHPNMGKNVVQSLKENETLKNALHTWKKTKVPVGIRSADTGMGIKIPHIEHATVGEIAKNFARVRATAKEDAYQLAKGNGGSGVKGTGNTSKAADDVVKDGSHFLDEFKLKPNVKYETNGYLYQTDELGRIERASGELTLEMGERNSKHQLAAGGENRVKAPSTQGDHGGHLIGTQFNGSPLIDNIVAMNGNVNVSAYKKLESAWAKALRDERKVIVDIRPVYEGNSVRPVSFNIKYRIDGEKFKASLKNVYGGK
ncbi:DNA/RNA non-specific endonuclease [Bacillus cytotoxicus]|uniref:DNA/RNA non-specific endonuclease n=1 Tax=Bacillus cytotoxicus TaxID=580165 RepID=UPI001AEE01F1|nr:DNA/RNA non-specific endonuclease [Bacillus cytotoxicus]QTR78228.1 DNA/RNA non-specific endonuclease [Bacillus cytotoxicus]QTR81957.1 DNA/RNA non-specific endonuclease [Bacillus cytotoxicus]QTR89123.1 DNA/RNA non-specific endonuclease [Bacillus cytotoxicus]